MREVKSELSGRRRSMGSWSRGWGVVLGDEGVGLRQPLLGLAQLFKGHLMPRFAVALVVHQLFSLLIEHPRVGSLGSCFSNHRVLPPMHQQNRQFANIQQIGVLQQIPAGCDDSCWDRLG